MYDSQLFRIILHAGQISQNFCMNETVVVIVVFEIGKQGAKGEEKFS